MADFLKRYGKTIAAVLGGVLMLVIQSGDLSWKSIGAAILTTAAVYFAPYKKKAAGEPTHRTGKNTIHGR